MREKVGCEVLDGIDNPTRAGQARQAVVCAHARARYTADLLHLVGVHQE